MLWVALGLAGAALGQDAGPALPYSPAPAARLPEPATRCDAPVLAPGAVGFTADAALAAQLAAVAAAPPAVIRIDRCNPAVHRAAWPWRRCGSTVPTPCAGP